MLPENILNTDTCPTYGSEMVLKTRALKKGVSPALIVIFSSVFGFVASHGGASSGAGMSSVMQSISSFMPIALVADPAMTGIILHSSTAFFMALTTSSLVSSPLSRYFSRSASSLSAIFSTSDSAIFAALANCLPRQA